jgi:hypothetical protein
MINKKFLAPILALAAIGLPLRASVATYCAGSGCGAANNTAFTNALATDGYTLQGLTTFVVGNLVGSTYTDPTTGIVFTDFAGSNLFIIGSELQTPTGVPVLGETILISIPAMYLAISLDVNIPSGLCTDAFCPANETAGFVGFINPGGLAPWSVYIQPASNFNGTGINSFSAATGGSETPEVGTLLLIGFGLIAMRWVRRVPRLPRLIFRTPRTI